MAFEYLGADIHVRGFQPQLAFLDALLGHTLQLIERILPVLGLVTTGLGHAAHPLQFRTIQVVGTCYLGALVVDTLLALLQIVGIIAPIGIDGAVVQLQDDRADTVQEEAVVGHHQQRAVAPLQIALQPFYHLQVQMVRRLVQYQQVGFRQQHVGQRHTLLLSAAELSHRLTEVAYLQLRQHLLGLQHLLFLTMMIETGVEHRLRRVERGCLLQEAHLQVAAEHDVALVVTLLAGEYREQRRLTRTVLRYQPHLLAFANREADVAEQLQSTERLAEMLNIKIGSHGIL